MNDRNLQYISQGETPKEHLANITNVCEAGCRWIQLRLKNVDVLTYLTTALECRNICDQYEAIMIINDNVSIAKASQADGIHLGLSDMNPREARGILGDNCIIGGTANTVDNCMQHIDDGVDYIGLGPYRYTSTKEELSPVLGLEGYSAIISGLTINVSHIPIVAIGGIELEDVSDIIKTGVGGIAVSGMLTGQQNLRKKVAQVQNIIKNP